MRRILLVVAASLSLGGCASYSGFSLDSLRPAPPPVTVQLESLPPGADARTSFGQSCKTPCSVSVPTAEGFSVSYTLPRFQPLTIPVQVTRVPGDFTTPASTTIDPNPVVGELQPLAPPKRAVRKMVKRPKPKAAPAAGAPAAGSPFPAPAGEAAPAR
jgi:hypothetical protein